MFCQTSHGIATSQSPYDPDAAGYAFCAPFGYYFAEAPPQRPDPAHLAALDRLGVAMIAQHADPADNSRIPPIFTYLGQFIDHDITAGTDRDQNGSRIDDADLVPMDRDTVIANMVNFRTGRLDLDSVYGRAMTAVTPDSADASFLARLDSLLRFPHDRAKMWIAFYADKANGVDLPKDRAGDLLRLGRLMQGAEAPVRAADLADLSPSLKQMFLNSDGTPNTQRAIIADARNDENLIVAQIHLAFLRLHNVIAQHCDDAAVLAEGRDAVFDWARQRTRWLYQWLVVNQYLPTICHGPTLARVMAGNGGFYDRWRARLGCGADHLPLPIEFSVAGFRFGHSMVRDAYDWNRFFGRGTAPEQELPRATFDLMFAFTGNGNLAGTGPRLPSNWGADWPRMVDGPTPGHEDRGARKIDTRLALPLASLPEAGANAILAQLAQRNLRRGHMLNLPSAQYCIAGFAAEDPDLRPLPGSALGDGEIGAILSDGNMTERTPLWYYVLREAEVSAGGESLGPLGTHIVAQTLLGLVTSDPASYWHQPGSDRGRWHPQDIAIGAFAPVTSMSSMLTVAGLYPHQD